MLPATEILQHQMRAQLAHDVAAEMRSNPMPEIVPGAKQAEVQFRRQQFVRTWNALAQRMATDDKDLPLILGSLTDMIPHRMSGLTTSAKMRAIVASHERLLLTLLFDPQLGQNNCRDPESPWLPLIPRGYRLSTHPEETFIHIGDSHISIIVDQLRPSYKLLALGQWHQDRSEGVKRDLPCDFLLQKIGKRPSGTPPTRRHLVFVCVLRALRRTLPTAHFEA